MFGIIGICVVIALLAVLMVFGYYLIYTNRINKKIRSGEVTGKRLVDIPKIIMIAVIIVLVLYCGVLSHALRTADSNGSKIVRNNYAVIDVSDPENYRYASYFGDAWLDDASFAKVYSVDQNAGYTKEVVEDGDFVFTVFKRNAAADSFHPDFLCYVEYTGNQSDDMVLHHSASFTSKDGSIGEGFGGEVSDLLLFIGNLDEDNVFTASFSLLDEKAESEFADAMQKAMDEDKGDFPSEKDFAIDTAEVTIGF